MEIHELVESVGWEGAQALAEAAFHGWEVELLGAGLAVLRRFEAELDRRHQEAVMGARRG